MGSKYKKKQQLAISRQFRSKPSVILCFARGFL